MRRRWVVFLALLHMIILSVPSAYAQEVDAVLEDTLTDNLSSEEDVKWYRFEMAEEGDAVLIAGSAQDDVSSFHHWRCEIYAEDMESMIAYDEVCGYPISTAGKTAGSASFISMPGLARGTYYIRMAYTEAGLLYSYFTSDPYELRLFQYNRATAAEYDGEGIQTFTQAGDLLWAAEGTGFLKLNDGECFMALMKNKNYTIVPVLISTDQAAVECVVSSTGKKITSSGSFHHEDSDTDYYYSNGYGVEQYASTSHSLPIVEVEHPSEIADRMLEAEMGKWDYWWMKHGDAVSAWGGIGLVILVLALIAGIGGGSGGGKDSDGDASGSLYEAIAEAWIDGL